MMKKRIAFIAAYALLFAGCEKMILGPEPENSPKSNFEILWNSLDQNYALFTVKGVNWDSLHGVYGSMITSNTNDQDLWNISTGLLSNLNDGHVSLVNKGYSKSFCSSAIAQRKAEDFSLDLVKESFLEGYSVVGGGNFTYGRIRRMYTLADIGYVSIATFRGSEKDGSPDWAYDIDQAVRDLVDCDGLIIDLRNNGGGLRVTLNIIASVFVDRDITYFYQRAKTGPGHDEFGALMSLSVSPRSGVQHFTKKIALLTNRFSASGSEHFTQVFRYLPYAKQIGDTTFGCFGDIVGTAELPNGWTYYFPCRLTTTPDGKCLEGLGMVPDILVENSRRDIVAGRDNVLQRAISYLSGF